MDRVELDLLVHDLDLQLDLVEGLCHGLELAHGVVHEPATLAPVVKVETRIRLVVAEVGRGSKSGHRDQIY